MKTLLAALTVLSLSACTTGAVGHGARVAPGPEGFDADAAVAVTSHGALPAPGPEAWRSAHSLVAAEH